MRKLLTTLFAVLLMLCMGLGLVGCKPIGEEQRKRLAQIPKEGSYIFRQSNGGITNGDEFISVESAARDEIKKQGKKLHNLNSCSFSYVLSDDGKYMWFLVEYSSKSSEEDWRHGEFKYAIGSTPLPNLDVKIEHYLPTQDYYIFGLQGKTGNYFICCDEFNLLAIDLTTFESRVIAPMGYTYHSELSCDEFFTLGYAAGDKTYYRIFDQDLKEYDVAFDDEWKGHVRVEGEYIFHYKKGNEVEKCRCIRYTTGEKLNQEQSYALYESLFLGENEVVEYPYAVFEYEGKVYRWESVTYSTETTAKDENGSDCVEKEYWEKLSVMDLETGAEYELLPTEMTGNVGAAMAQILDIYGGLEWKQVLVQDGELFFVMVNETSFFGVPTPRTSPRIVFKYDAKTGNLAYVGYAAYTYYDITQIYNRVA